MADLVEAVRYDWPYDGALDPSKMALLIIDRQHDFCGKGGYVDLMGYDISQTARTIAPIKAVLDTVRCIPGFTVSYTREGHRPDLADLPANKPLAEPADRCGYRRSWPVRPYPGTW